MYVCLLLVHKSPFQIQLESGVKVVLWKEYTIDYVGIAFIWRDAPPVAYRCGAIGCPRSFRIDDSRVPLYHSEKFIHLPVSTKNRFRTKESVEQTLDWLSKELTNFSNDRPF